MMLSGLETPPPGMAPLAKKTAIEAAGMPVQR